MNNHSAMSSASEQKRVAIIEAARDLFAERGFHGTAVPLIADRAGVGAGTIYRHFESKENLVNVVYRQCKTTMMEVLLDDFPVAQPPRLQFRAFWRRLAQFARENPQAMAFLALHHHAPYLDAESLALEELSLTPALSFIGAAQAQLVIKEIEPAALAALVTGAFHGLFQGAEQGLYVLDEGLMDTTENCLWEAVRR
jgi:TetR/AcrR family transcriptional regulator, repressor of fatR-cypB operon